MHSPVPVTTLQQGEVTDGIGATQRIVGGTPPLPRITPASGAHFPVFPSPIHYLSLPLPFFSDDFIGHTYIRLDLA